jgi:hypothetical protein
MQQRLAAMEEMVVVERMDRVKRRSVCVGVLFVLWCACGFVLGFWVQEAWGQGGVSQTEVALQEARLALALGKMERWREQIFLAEAAYKKESGRMDPEKKDSLQLWLFLLLSKFYQFKGLYPPIKNIESFPQRQNLVEFISTFEAAIDALEKAHLYQRNYNNLYTRVAQRSDLKVLIQIQASNNIERDLASNIQQGKIYVALLRYALSNWGNAAIIQSKERENREILESLKKKAAAAEKDIRDLRTNQTKLAEVVKDSQEEFSRLRKALEGRRSVGTVMIWSGVVASGLGLVSLVVGPILYVDAESNKDYSVDQADRQKLIGVGLSAGGGGVLLVGVTLIIVGVNTLPSKKDQSQSVIKSQNRYLKYEEERQQKMLEVR